MSYASIVSPGGATLTPGGGGGAQPEAAVEAKEIVVAEEAHPPVDDDLEGVQEGTSKKEKVRDRDKRRTRKKKPGSSKRSREAKEGSHKHGDEQQSSKEVAPEKDEVDKEEIEYVPAPPPKTNPWKKPVVDQPVPEKSSKPSSDAKTVDMTVVTEKLKPEKTTKVKPSTGESKQQQTVSKSNPWKKLEKSSKAVDEEVGGGEAGEDERRGEKGSSTWPTLAIKPSKKKKEGEEVSSVEEGKENQDTSNINNNHLKSINNNNMK